MYQQDDIGIGNAQITNLGEGDGVTRELHLLGLLELGTSLTVLLFDAESTDLSCTVSILWIQVDVISAYLA